MDTVLLHLLAFPLGLLTMNAGEWVLHRYLLHGVGRRKASFWSFHWREHHSACRRHDMADPDYARFPLGAHAQGKETWGLIAVGVAHLPLLLVAPGYVAAVLFSLAWYYRVHRRSHEDLAWAKAHLPWHYDHHMGPDQDRNWCVSWPWFDHIMDTRVPYLGTERADRDERRRAERAAARLARLAG